MTTAALPLQRPLGAARAILYGTLTVGVMDGLDAVIFWWLRRGTSPSRIFQSIAAGLLGRDEAVAGGLPAAALGLALHFFISFAVVSTYFLAARRFVVLRRETFVCGLLYGVAVHFFMSYLVIPLSAIGTRPVFVLPVFINSILIHMFGVGLPAALFARFGQR